MAVFLGDRRVFLSSELTRGSQILIRRTITDRTQAIAPFLTYDADPYLVIADGRLIWVMDAYTTTDPFPGATPYGDINYIRNTVKVTVDAYSGEIIFYRTGVADPIADAYGQIFGGLFRPITEAPAEVAAHFRYPEGMFNVQSELFAAYHVTDPVAFYNGEDRWEVAEEVVEDPDTGRQELSRMEAYYMTLPMRRQPGTSAFGLVRPFTPNQRENMSAWMAGYTDDAGDALLFVYRFPRQVTVYGPQQVESLIEPGPVYLQPDDAPGPKRVPGDPGQSARHPDRGNGPLRAATLRAGHGRSGSTTELTYVIVATSEQVEMAPTLAEALGAIVAGGEQPPPDQQPAPTDEPAAPSAVSSSLANRPLDTYERAQEALQRGDWATYGEEQAALQELLLEIVAETEETAPAATPSP